MTKKELRKLSRAELLEMLIHQSADLQDCREKLAAAEEALQNREIAIDKAGSIAEASLSLNGVFEAAQLACRQYTENVRLLSERQDAICAKMEAEGRARADALLFKAQQESAEIRKKTETECAALLEKAKAEAQRYWDEVSDKLKAFYEAHADLQELLPLAALPKQKREPYEAESKQRSSDD